MFVRLSSRVMPGASVTVWYRRHGGIKQSCCWSIICNRKMYGQLIIGMIIWYEKSVAHARVCAITRLKGVILFSESLLSRLVQEPNSYVVPELGPYASCGASETCLPSVHVHRS